MKNHDCLRLLIPAWLLVFTASVSAENWQRIAEEDGITIYSRKKENSRFFEFRGRGKINAPATKVFTIVQDVGKMSSWVTGSKNVVLVEKNFNSKSYQMNFKDYYQILYAQNATPWPLEDRDYVLYGNVDYEAETETAVIRLKSIRHPSFPAKKGITRMVEMGVVFKVTPVDQGKNCLVDFAVHVDPGGNIPAWAVNFMAKNEPLKTLRSLRKLSAGNNYDHDIEKLVNFHLEKLRKKKK